MPGSDLDNISNDALGKAAKRVNVFAKLSPQQKDIMKYIKMTASSNFGNMFSVLVSSAFLPFMPMMSIHLILLGLIYDLSCKAIPWDNVDEEYLKTPRKWDASGIGKFMV